MVIMVPDNQASTIAIQVLAGSGHTALVTTQGEICNFGSNNTGQLGLGDFNDRYAPTIIPGFSNVLMVSCRAYHTGEIYTFGDQLSRNIPTLISGYNDVTPVYVSYCICDC